MPKEGSIIEFYDGQNQFKIPFMMYADFEAILKPIQGSRSGPCQHSPNSNEPYTKKLIDTFHPAFVSIASSLMDLLKIHWGSIEVSIV